jgi:hypothetical protein
MVLKKGLSSNFKLSNDQVINVKKIEEFFQALGTEVDAEKYCVPEYSSKGDRVFEIAFPNPVNNAIKNSEPFRKLDDYCRKKNWSIRFYAPKKIGEGPNGCCRVDPGISYSSFKNLWNGFGLFGGDRVERARMDYG